MIGWTMVGGGGAVVCVCGGVCDCVCLCVYVTVFMSLLVLCDREVWCCVGKSVELLSKSFWVYDFGCTILCASGFVFVVSGV